MVAILLAGFVAYEAASGLRAAAGGLSDDPGATFYPGASPEVMATFYRATVTAPLERQFGQIPGLQQMTSTSSSAAARVVTLQFTLSESYRCRAAGRAGGDQRGVHYLPKDLPNPPVYSKVNPADAPILTLALTSDSLALSKVEDLADTVMAQKISQLSGVGLVSINGGQKPAVRIQANPTALANYGLSLEDVRTALGTANVDQAKGSINGPRAVVHDRRERSAAFERGLQQGDHRVPQWFAGAAVGCGQCGG
jgi:multidrug efflux pump